MSWSSTKQIKLIPSTHNQLNIGLDSLNDSEPSIGTNDMNNVTKVYLTLEEALALAKTIGKLKVKLEWVEKNIDCDLSEESYREILENLEKIAKKIQFVLPIN